MEDSQLDLERSETSRTEVAQGTWPWSAAEWRRNPVQRHAVFKC